MRENFEASVVWLLRDETGPEGIALRGSAPAGKLQEENVRDWLLKDYWVPMFCNDLASGVDYFIFDLSFRFEPGRTATWLEHAQRMGENTRAIISTLDGISRSYLRSHRDWFEQKHRWTNRCNRVEKRALELMEKG